MNVCAYSSICEEDSHWLPQYLAEAERLHMPFVMHFDRCSLKTVVKTTNHLHCVGHTEQPDAAMEFNEMHKQAALDVVASLDYDWAMAWDIDETYERDAPAKLEKVMAACQSLMVDFRWVNLWNDREHIRVDGTFGEGHRIKLYDLKRAKWRFTHPITNGPKPTDAKGNILEHRLQDVFVSDIVCLHHGNLTRDMRLQRKARWDRIYTAAVGGNPYKFWAYMCDEERYPPVIERHGYL